MRVIIAGSRNITDPQQVAHSVIMSSFKITEVVSGCARGVDTLGEEFAATLNIPVKKFPADWNTWGKAAGFKRNQEMADYADALIAIWDGESRGTMDMIEKAKEKGLKIFVDIVPKTCEDKNVGSTTSRQPKDKEKI